MNLKEVLLSGWSFNEILNKFSIDRSNFTIRDENVILSKRDSAKGEIFREKILIEGKSNGGSFLNFFGTLHYNLLSQLAVFELDYVEKDALQAACE